MKTLFGAIVALGLLSTAASAQYCPPGYGYGGYAPRTAYGYGGYGAPRTIIKEAPAAQAQPIAPEAAPKPIEPEAAPAQPQPEAAPPK